MTTTAKNYKEAIDEMIDAETATNILNLEKTNDIILEAIDNLVLAATGEYPGTKETWKYCGHDSVTLREAIEDIEAHHGFITPENKRLFIAAYIAIDALNEYR